MHKVIDQLIVGSYPLLAAHQHQQRVDEQLGVDRHVRVEPVICLRARDGERR